MAIAVQSSASNQTASSTSATLTIDCTSCTALVGFIYSVDQTGLTAAYNGVSMTQVVQQTADGSVTGFILFNPSSGSHNLVYSWTNSTENAAFAIGLSGGATSGVLNTDYAVAKNHATNGNTQSVTTTPVQTGSMLLCAFRVGDGTNACTTNNTQISTQGGFGCRSGEYHTTTAATPVTQSGTHANNSGWGMVAIEYALTTVPTVNSGAPFFGFM